MASYKRGVRLRRPLSRGLMSLLVVVDNEVCADSRNHVCTDLFDREMSCLQPHPDSHLLISVFISKYSDILPVICNASFVF